MENISDYIKDKYTFKEIIEHQKLPLETKVEISKEILSRVFKLSKHNVSISFSGGKDSTVLADMVERFFPQEFQKTLMIFGNTGVEFPESLKFARQYGKEHFGDRFYETEFTKLEEDELRYDFAAKLVKQLEDEGCLDEILKEDGKLKGQKALIAAATKRGYELTKENCFFKGHPMNFMYCLEQYGLPLLGKSASKLDAHRINIECFLKYSESATTDEKLKEYYDVLRGCKFSQHCCKLIKKEPAEKLQKELDVDVVIKGLMAEESHARMLSLSVRGHIFKSSRSHIKDGGFYHVNPLGLWTDEDIWAYIHKYNVEYSPLYDITYTALDGTEHHIRRNGCMFCGTDIQFKDNHLMILRQTHPKAYDVCMEQFGYRNELNKLFDIKKNKYILMAASDVGKSARIINAVGDNERIRDVRPCAYDDIGEMLDLNGTGLDSEYDPEE